MGRRVEFQVFLEAFLGSKNVYFQPPNNLRMEYPCIVYHRDYSDDDYADNLPYRRQSRYLLTYITRDPDDPVREAIAGLPLCRFSRFYTAQNLNHDVFNIYF